MKIATTVVFKDEADILPAYLKAMEKHVDYFLWLDNESTDGGAEIVKAHPKTVFCETIKGQYKLSMQGGLIEEAQKYLTHDDWFCMGAPDLFPMFDVRKAIIQADKEGHHCIDTYFPTFFFTKEMLSQYIKDARYRKQIDSFNPHNYIYYKNVSRHTIVMIKNTTVDGKNVHYKQPKQEPPSIPGGRKTKFTQLFFAHYRFRSPSQIQGRMAARKLINPNRKKGVSFRHYPTWDWKEYLIAQKYLFKFTDIKSINFAQSSFDTLLSAKEKE